MSAWRTGKLILAFLLFVILTSTSPLQPASAPVGSLALPKQSSLQLVHAAPEHATLFSDNFNALSNDWNITEGTWNIVSEPHNNVLEGAGHAWATLNLGDHWTDYTFTVKVKFTTNSAVQLMTHMNSLRGRYIIGMHAGGMYLQREYPWEKISSSLDTDSTPNTNDTWYTVSIDADMNRLTVSVDGSQRLSYTDSWGGTLWEGTVGLEVTGGEFASARFDDVNIYGVLTPYNNWVKTGGPIGGLGYDVRYGASKNVLYVTDNYSGVNKSQDGGVSWFATNRGITGRFGASGDAVPVFSLTVDPNNPNTIWAGLKDAKGAFKSTNAGQTWTDVTPNITETQFIFRGFTIQPENSNIVYAQGELPTTKGVEFDKAKGRIYRTPDGGTTWEKIWEGENLVRYVIIHPNDPNTLYASLGIFDREANDSDCSTAPPDQGTGGVLKLQKQGSGWDSWYKNTGLEDMNVGSLVMHPTNPDILLAGAGNNACSKYNLDTTSYNTGGVYLTENGGESWEKTLPNEIITSVEWGPPGSNLAYAGGQLNFYISHNGGRDWTKVAGQTYPWGPYGVVAGFPIDILVDPDNSNKLFVNNYGGGNVLSTDGGVNWSLASQGCTGALLLGVAVHPQNPKVVYATGRSGAFRSADKGNSWSGLSYSPALLDSAYDVAIKPDQPNVVLVSSELLGYVYRSANSGLDWTLVYTVPGVIPGVYSAQHGMKVIEFARPPNSNVVYGGSCRGSVGLQAGFTASKGVFKSTNGGVSWVPANDSNTDAKCFFDLAIHPTNPDIVYAASPAAGLYRTGNGGTSWTLMSGLPTDVRSVAIHPTSPNIVYAGTLDNGVYITSDSLNWDRMTSGMEPNDAIYKIAINPVDPDIVYAASFRSGVYRWIQDEFRWTHINNGLFTRSIMDMVISSDGEVLYAATSGEGVFRLGEPTEYLLFLPTVKK